MQKKYITSGNFVIKESSKEKNNHMGYIEERFSSPGLSISSSQRNHERGQRAGAYLAVGILMQNAQCFPHEIIGIHSKITRHTKGRPNEGKLRKETWYWKMTYRFLHNWLCCQATWPIIISQNDQTSDLEEKITNLKHLEEKRKIKIIFKKYEIQGAKEKSSRKLVI